MTINPRILLIGSVWIALAKDTKAELVQWRIDPLRTSITLSGEFEVNDWSAPLTPQAPGALTTTFIGTLDSNMTFRGGIPLSIAFAPESSQMFAVPNGTWQPGGSNGEGESGVAGGVFDFGPEIGQILAAFRNGQSDVWAPNLTLAETAPGSNDYTVSGTMLLAATGDTELMSQGPELGTIRLATRIPPGFKLNRSGAGSISFAGYEATYTLPVDVFSRVGITPDFGADLYFTGTVVLTATVPESSSLLMAGFAASCALGFVHRAAWRGKPRVRL